MGASNTDSIVKLELPEHKEHINTTKSNLTMQKVQDLLSGQQSVPGLFSSAQPSSGSFTSDQPSGYFGSGQPGSTVQQAMSNITSRMQNLLNIIQQLSRNVMDNLRYYVQQYPPLAAFLFTLLALSIIPITFFLLFAGGSIAVTLSTALIGFGLIEGFLLMISGGILALVLGGVTLVTGVGFAWLLGIWLVYKGGSYVMTRVGGTAGSLGESVTGSFRQMGQQFKESVSQMASTASGQMGQQMPSGMGGAQGSLYQSAPQGAYQPQQQQPQQTSSFVPSTAGR